MMEQVLACCRATCPCARASQRGTVALAANIDQAGWCMCVFILGRRGRFGAPGGRLLTWRFSGKGHAVPSHLLTCKPFHRLTKRLRHCSEILPCQGYTISKLTCLWDSTHRRLTVSDGGQGRRACLGGAARTSRPLGGVHCCASCMSTLSLKSGMPTNDRTGTCLSLAVPTAGAGLGCGQQALRPPP